MAFKKRKKRSTSSTKSKRKTGKKRQLVLLGKSKSKRRLVGNKSSITDMVTRAGVGTVAQIAAGILGNYIPGTDNKIKSAVVAAAGIALGMSGLAKNKLVSQAAVSLTEAGLMGIAKMQFPQIKFLNGEEEYNVMGLPEDIPSSDPLLGIPIDRPDPLLGYQEEDYQSDLESKYF